MAKVVNKVYVEKSTKEVISHMDVTDREVKTVLAYGNASDCMLRAPILFNGKDHIGSRFGGTDYNCYLGVNRSSVWPNEEKGGGEYSV